MQQLVSELGLLAHLKMTVTDAACLMGRGRESLGKDLKKSKRTSTPFFSNEDLLNFRLDAHIGHRTGIKDELINDYLKRTREPADAEHVRTWIAFMAKPIRLETHQEIAVIIPNDIHELIKSGRMGFLKDLLKLDVDLTFFISKNFKKYLLAFVGENAIAGRNRKTDFNHEGNTEFAELMVLADPSTDHAVFYAPTEHNLVRWPVPSSNVHCMMWSIQDTTPWD